MNDSKKLYVDVPLFCNRKKREYPVRMPIEEAQVAAEAADKKLKAAQALEQQLGTIPNLPDCILYYKGQAVILANVNEKSDDAVRRALNAAIGEDVYPVPEVKTREKKDAPAAAE